MHKSLIFLVDEYCETLAHTRRTKVKATEMGKEGKEYVSILSGIENSLSWDIEFMVSGYMPYYSEGPFRKQVPTDPQKVLSRYSNEIVRQQCNEEKIEMVLKILDQLSDKEKDAVMLICGECKSVRKAAKIMKMPASTVWDNYKRALKKLEGIEVEQYRVKGGE